jgi:hypothetical protein
MSSVTFKRNSVVSLTLSFRARQLTHAFDLPGTPTILAYLRTSSVGTRDASRPYVSLPDLHPFPQLWLSNDDNFAGFSEDPVAMGQASSPMHGSKLTCFGAISRRPPPKSG